MATPTRHYVIRDTEKQIVGLVEAASPSQAMRHHVRQMFTATPATAEDAYEAAVNGIRFESATAEPGSHEARD